MTRPRNIDTLDGMLSHIIRRLSRIERQPLSAPTAIIGLTAVENADHITPDAPVGAAFFLIDTGQVLRMTPTGLTHLDLDGNVESYDHYTAGD